MTIEEDVVSGPGRWSPAAARPELAWRNTETMRRLAFVAERRACDDLRRGRRRAGPNGLVAANRLVDAGWSVLVLEEQPDLGGAVRSDRELDPDFVHDTFSAFYPLAAASRTIGLRLEEHGLVWEHAPAVLGHPFPDGSWGMLHRDRQVTAGWPRSSTPATARRGWSCAASGTCRRPADRRSAHPVPPGAPGLGLLAGWCAPAD